MNDEIKNDLGFKIYEGFVDWFDNLEKEPSFSQCWKEGFKKGQQEQFSDKLRVVVCPKCGAVGKNVKVHSI